MNGIRCDFRAMSGKITKFLRNNLLQQLYCKLLTFKVPDICDDDLPVRIEEFVVFVVGCDKNIRALPLGSPQQEAACTPTNGYGFNGLAQ